VTGPSAAAALLGQRLSELHKVIEQMHEAEQDALTARHTADLEEAKEYLRGQGSIENRKNEARVKTANFEFEALVAEANVRHLGRLYKEAQMRVDAGRTYSADLRAELASLGRDGTP
jgi:hypothetical protein